MQVFSSSFFGSSTQRVIIIPIHFPLSSTSSPATLDKPPPYITTLKTPGSAWPGKGSVGAKLHSGSKITRKLVSFLQTWQIMGSDWRSSGSYSASSWLISGSSLTRNGVWPQWTLSGSNSDPGVFRDPSQHPYYIHSTKQVSSRLTLFDITREILNHNCSFEM